MKITYLDHSGFAVEQDSDLIVFDACNPRPVPGASGLASGTVTEEELRGRARSTLMLSHSHSDHCCPEIMALPFDEVLLSEDFPPSAKGRRVREGETLRLPGMTVRVFGSTDLGVSFLVDVGGQRLFHAGDFNLWHWEEESTPAEIREATDGFERILADLAPYAGSIDAAFFPLDPRMGRSTDRGARRFLEAVRPAALIPMHCQGDAALPARFAAQYPGAVRPMTRRGCTLDL